MSEEQEVVIVGPGEILRKAREAANLTADDIATKIRLKRTLIEDIEQDNYDINISLTFIKGYLKLYAKQVNVPEAEIVAAFERLNTQKKEPAKLQSFSRRFNHQANDDKLMLVTYLIVAVVIALVVVWWFQQSENESSIFSTDTITGQQTSENTSSQVSLTSELESSNTATTTELTNASSRSDTEALIGTELDSDKSALTTELESEGPTNSLSESVEQVINEVEPLTNIDSSELADDQGVSEDLVEQSLDAQSLAPSASLLNDTNDIANVAPVELVFEFLDNCWTNISDATGEDIAYGVKTKGRVMPISGIPPFIVTLGAPEVVKITYAGQPVDMSFIKPGRSAKFELPLAE